MSTGEDAETDLVIKRWQLLCVIVSLSHLHDLRPNAWSIARVLRCARYFGQLNAPKVLKAACMIDAPQLLSTPPPPASPSRLIEL
jgi:hypothetical protein